MRSPSHIFPSCPHRLSAAALLSAATGSSAPSPILVETPVTLPITVNFTVNNDGNSGVWKMRYVVVPTNVSVACSSLPHSLL